MFGYARPVQLLPLTPELPHHQTVISWQLCSSVHPSFKDIQQQIWWYDNKINHWPETYGVLVPWALMNHFFIWAKCLLWKNCHLHQLPITEHHSASGQAGCSPHHTHSCHTVLAIDQDGASMHGEPSLWVPSAGCCYLFFYAGMMALLYSSMNTKHFWTFSHLNRKRLIWKTIQKIFLRFWGTYLTTFPPRKRSRRRDKRSSILVRIKTYLKSHGVKKHHTCTHVLPSFSALWDQSRYRFSWHRWDQHVGPPAPSDLPAKPPPVWRWVRSYRSAVNHNSLRLLGRAPVSSTIWSRFRWLLNTRSFNFYLKWHLYFTRTLFIPDRNLASTWWVQVSLGILQDFLSKYQNSVKAAKSAFMSSVISNNSHKPWGSF